MLHYILESALTRRLLGALIVISCMVAGCSERATAGSLVREELSTLSNISLVVLVPRYQPIPGVTPDELQRRIASHAGEILNANGIAIENKRAERLVIDLQFEQATPDVLAVLVQVQLFEPASLQRKWSPVARKLDLISWQHQDLLTIKRGDVAPIISAVVEDMTRFVGEAKQARGAVE